MLGRCVHDVDPNRHGQFVPERAAINLLRLVEARPNRAGKIAVVTGEKRVGEIVGRASLARQAGNFLQAILRVRGFSRSSLERIDQTGMHFISCLRFDDVLPVAVLPLARARPCRLFLRSVPECAARLAASRRLEKLCRRAQARPA